MIKKKPLIKGGFYNIRKKKIKRAVAQMLHKRF